MQICFNLLRVKIETKTLKMFVLEIVAHTYIYLVNLLIIVYLFWP